MASPHTPGTGMGAPVHRYAAAISSQFPIANKIRDIESSILSRHRLDNLPVNQTNQALQDNYLEFRIGGIQGQYLDLTSLALELDITITKTDGKTPLATDDYAILADGAGMSTLFKNITCFLNEQMVESNSAFAIWGFIKALTSFRPDQLDTIARNGGLYSKSSAPATFTESSFTKAGSLEGKMAELTRGGSINLCTPVMLDIASIDAFLLDMVDVRLRFELGAQSFVINSDKTNREYQYTINSARLWIDRVVPFPAALKALNQSMIDEAVEYIYNRTLQKSYILGVNQTSLTADLLWSQVVPRRLYIVIVDLEALTGKYDSNGVYFQNGDLSNVTIAINGSPVYQISSDFGKNKFSCLYYETLKALGLEQSHLLTREAFKDGRTVMVFSFDGSEEGTLSKEISGNLRVTLNFAEPKTSNRCILMFGESTGVIRIDSKRAVTCDVRA